MFFGAAFRVNSVCWERMDEVGLEIAGKLEEALVEKAVLEAAIRQVCLSIEGRTIEVMMSGDAVLSCCGFEGICCNGRRRR